MLNETGRTYMFDFSFYSHSNFAFEIYHLNVALDVV